MTALVLRGQRVRVRPLRRADAPTLGRFLKDSRVTRYLPPRVRRETGPEFVERVLGEQRQGDGFAFAILAAHAGEVVGQIRLMNWSRLEHHAEIGYWIGRTHWGQGFGTESVRLVCRYGFRSLHLHRITAVIVAGNERSERTLRRAGFRLEGTSRLAARVSSGWRDERLFGLLRGELRLR